MTPAGFPHSEIPGSKRVCRSPGLIAACRVLHRRSAPRHSPFTLSSLAIKYFRRESYKYSRFNLLITRFCCQRPLSSSLASALLGPSLGRGGGPGEPGLGFIPEHDGGADRARTDDLRLAKPPLSQLSYSPLIPSMVGLDRLELSTPRLSSVCSNQLSYRPSETPAAKRVVRIRKNLPVPWKLNRDEITRSFVDLRLRTLEA